MSKNLSWIDLDEKINLIYNFMYEESIKSCFKIDPINLGSIKLEDIKIPLKNDSNEVILKDILDGNFQLLKFDKHILIVF